MIFLLSWWLVKNELSISHLARSWIGFWWKETQTKLVFKIKQTPNTDRPNFKLYFVTNFICYGNWLENNSENAFKLFWKMVLSPDIKRNAASSESNFNYRLENDLVKFHWTRHFDLFVLDLLSLCRWQGALWRNTYKQEFPNLFHCNFSNSFWIPSSPLFLIPHLPLELVYKP